MGLQATSQAAGVGAAAQNKSFAVEARNLPRKILLVGLFDDTTKTGIIEHVPLLITSPEDAADKLGFGFMLHRLAIKANVGSNGVETWAAPQDQPGAGVAATGTVTLSGTASAAGTLYLYIAGDLIQVAVPKGTTAAQLGPLVETAVNADTNLPVTAGAVAAVVTMTAKDKATWGNKITLTFNWGFQEVMPAGISAVVVDMASGAGAVDVDPVLVELGSGDDSNEDHFTGVVHGYLQDSGVLDSFSDYVGEGNDFLGCYSKTVARPFRVLTGDTDPGSSALTALLALGNGRKQDRTNGVIAVPDSPNHPSEIAALAIGIMERTNNDRAAESYIGKLMPGIIAGPTANRWTKEYDDRDTAVKAGVSPTVVESGAVLLQNVMTFYHPDAVPITSNGYRSMRNISIIQNILSNQKANFNLEKWKSIIIVEDITKVKSNIDRQKTRDIGTVEDDLIALATEYAGKAWLYTDAFTIDRIKAGGLVEIRPGGTGFNTTLPIILSGEGAIIDNLVEFDVSLAVLTQ